MNTYALPQPEAGQDNRDIELIQRALNVLFKWKWLIVTCFAAVVIPVLAVSLLKTPEYQPITKILLKRTRAETAISPGQGERFLAWSINDQLINSEIQILKSEDVVRKAVEKSGYPLLDGEEGSQLKKERALQSLRTRIAVTPLPNSNVISVSLRARDPRAAARLLNTLVALYLEKHATLRRSGENTAKFFEDQTQLAKGKLAQARENLKRFQVQLNILDISNERNDNMRRLSSLDARLKDFQAKISGSEKEILALEREMRQLPDQIAQRKRVIVNPEVTLVTSKLVELERERDGLLQLYTPKSRLVMDKEGLIASMQQKLQGLNPTIVGDTVIAQNGVRETVQRALLAKKASLDSLRAQRASLQPGISRYRARLDVLKDSTFELGRLRKQFDHTRETYLLYLRKAEEARISTAMDDEKLINAAVIEKASPPLFPLGRGLAMAAALAAISGLALGIMIAFGLEFFNSTIKDEDDVERFLGVPVLATISHF